MPTQNSKARAVVLALLFCVKKFLEMCN